jgi:hypothetical protein
MLVRVAQTALAVLICTFPQRVGADTVSSLEVTRDSVTVTVPINIVGVDATTLARWAAAIDRVWNRGNQGQPFSYCGRTVTFDARFAVQATTPASRSSHLVLVRQVKPGDAFVSSVWHALGTSPRYSPRTGYWASDLDDDTVAHEFGHLLGLLDEYIENDANQNGMREPGERPVPDVARHPDAWFSLMAGERGVVLRRHVLEVLRMHGIQDALTCGTP